LVWLDKAPSA